MDAKGMMEMMKCSFAYNLAKATYESAEEVDETGLAQIEAEQEWVIDYTPGLTKGDACVDADGMMEMMKCSFAYNLAKAAYENANEGSEDPDSGVAQQE